MSHAVPEAAGRPAPIGARRLLDRPIVQPQMDGRMGVNLNGPSLIRVPAWVRAPLGRLYLYFADHRGRYLRLAHADDLTGPWRTHEAGVLELERTGFPTEDLGPHELGLYAHVASPDVHVVEAAEGGRQIRMYFHGLHARGADGGALQRTRVALSEDGLAFDVLPELLGPPYFRVFRHGGWWYALAMPGLLLRSRDGLSGFEPGPELGEPDMRHVAVLMRGRLLHLFWTRVGDAPESLLHSTLDLAGDWRSWRLADTRMLLRPELPWEGAGLPPIPSRRGAIDGPVNQLRDPCIFEDGGRTYLLYSGAGEHGIGLAELDGLDS